MANDGDGEPLGKASTISYNDTTTLKDDAVKVSVGNAYAEGSDYVDDPDVIVNEKKEELKESYREKLHKKYDQIKSDVTDSIENAKKNLTKENVKKYVKEIANNAANNLKEDTKYLGNQAASSVKNIGLTEKESIKKYGDVQFPTLFGGKGGFADLINNDKPAKRKIKQVDSFSNDINNNIIAVANAKRKTSNPFENMGERLDPFKQMKNKGNIKIKSNIKSNRPRPMSLNDVGVVSNIFGNTKPNRRPMSLNDVGVVLDPLSNMRGKSNKVKPISFINIGIVSSPFKQMKVKSNKVKPSKNKNNIDSVFKMDIFGQRKRRRGLF